MKGFNSVNRMAAPVTDTALDPLSMFVMQTDRRTPSPVDEEPEYVHTPPPRRVPSVRLDASSSSSSMTPARSSSPMPNSSSATNSISAKSSAFKKVDELQTQFASFSSTLTSTISNLSSNISNFAPSATGSDSRPQTLDRDSSLTAAQYVQAHLDRNTTLAHQVPSADSNDSLRYLAGEQKLMLIPHCTIQICAHGLLSGWLYITNYRLVFQPASPEVEAIARTNPSIHSYLQVPLGCIDKLEREKRPKEQLNTAQMTVVVSCKDCRQLRIHIKGSNSTSITGGDYEMEKIFSVMTAYSFPNNLRYVFAFSHVLPVPKQGSDLVSEYTRMGVLEFDDLRFTDCNREFRLCSTYADMLVVPAGISDDELFVVANFRAGQRLPALSWVKRDNGATLWRSSQPKCGVSGSCAQDEKMLDVIAKVGYKQKFNKKRYNQELVVNIVDCRSKASAMANRAAGAGYESQTNYTSSRIDFYNIPNIHGVRDSYKALSTIVVNPTANPSSDVSFSKQVDDTNWLTNIRLILKAGWDTATMLMAGQPVLVHCSHGWDRTAQVCAIGQLFLDPYYRTMEGFAVLVEKEWNSFGHTFYQRCAQGQDKQTRAEDQVSQIFVQFLDSIWQIQKQYSQYFEFNSKYLLAVADHIYSCRFGTFLCNSDQDRRVYKVQQLTSDLWTFLRWNRETFLNKYYIEQQSILLPPLGQLLRGVTLWSDFFLRFSSVHSLPTVPAHLEKFLAVDHRDHQGADLALLPMTTTNDYYEALINKERSAKLKLEEQLRAADLNIKSLVLEMEEIVQGKLTEGELSKFAALKQRCLEQVDIADETMKELDRVVTSSSVEDVVEVNLDVADSMSSKIADFDDSPTRDIADHKVRTDSVTEVGYVLPKFSDNHDDTSEFLV